MRIMYGIQIKNYYEAQLGKYLIIFKWVTQKVIRK